MSGFNFGTASGGTGAVFNFGGGAPPNNTAAASATQPGFGGFGATAPNAVPSGQSTAGFNFGTPSFGAAAAATIAMPTAPVSTGLNSGVTPASMTTSAVAPGFNFGGNPTATVNKPATTTGFAGFKLGGGLAKPPAVATVPSGSSAGLNLTTTKATPTLSGLLGAAPPASAVPATTAVPTLTLGGAAQTGFNFGGAAKPIAATIPTPATTTGTLGSGVGAGLGGSLGSGIMGGLATGLEAGLTGGLTAGLKLGVTPAAIPTVAALPATTAGFGVGSLAAGTVGTTAAPTTTAVAATGFGLGEAAIISAQATLSTATTTTSSGARAPTMTYHQLEEQINKWMLELDDQEKNFLQKATQVNAWDRLLIDNGDKITGLNTDVERMKIDQQRLDHELDFILAQQRELEEMLNPLEKSVEQLPPINYQQHADLEREHTYQLAENVDAQLKRMCQDLKEIIEHLNTNNSATDNSDPIYQIGKILNVHMDSIQWIDQNTAHLQRRVEDVSKQAELRRKEQERNFRLAYN